MPESGFEKINKQTVSAEALGPSEDVAGFRSIFKATSIFGGVQVFNIIISIVRGKVLAVLIGTAGMGLNGLLMSSLKLVERASGLGLSESAVRDISAANESNEKNRIRFVYTVFNRWIWLTAIIGVVVTIALSPILSKIAFGDKSHSISFLLLSITFIFGALTGGIYTLLRGMRRIKDLARANISGSVAGLLVAIPIFYFYGIEGVVPAIIASSVTTYIVSLYFRHRVEIKPMQLSIKDTFSGGKQMVALGITLTLTALLNAGMKFILNAYISKVGSLDDLGIFNAGNSIISGYVGMVFTAMGTDYYPRLSGVISIPEKWKKVVNQQAEIVVLILGPILAFILFSAPIIIRILLSAEFLTTIDYITWASISVLFRGISWVSGFILISKGDNKLFLYTQLASQIWFLALDILFFNLLGIKGLGISLIISYLLAVILMFYVLKKKYNFVLSRAAYTLSGVFILLLGITVTFISIWGYPRAYYIAAITFAISLVISIKGLNSRMDLKHFIKNFLNKNK